MIRGVRVDSTGNIYAASDLKAFKIDTYGVVQTFTTVSSSGCNDVEIDSNGNVYVKELKHIKKIAPDGSIQALGGNVVADITVYAIKVDSNGLVYVIDGSNNALKKLLPFTTTTTTTGFYSFL